MAYKLTDGLIEFWKLDEASGTRNGALGSFNLAEIGGATGVGSFNPEFNTVMQASACAVFTGTTSLAVASAANLQIDNTKAFSISGWIKADSAVTRTTAFGKAGSGNTDYTVDMQNLSSSTDTRYTFYLVDIASQLYQTIPMAGPIADESLYAEFGNMYKQKIFTSWMHMVGVFIPGATISASVSYINGVQYGTNLNPIPTSLVVPGTNKFAVGARVTSGDAQSANFSGSVCNVGIWRRALTPENVGDLYNGGNTLAYPFTNAAGASL